MSIKLATLRGLSETEGVLVFAGIDGSPMGFQNKELGQEVLTSSETPASFRVDVDVRFFQLLSRLLEAKKADYETPAFCIAPTIREYSL